MPRKTNAQLREELARLKAIVQGLQAEPAIEMSLPEDPDADGEYDPEAVGFFIDANDADHGFFVDAYRYDDEGDGKVRYVHRFAAEDFSLQAVKDRFGGGRYNLRLKEARSPYKLVRSHTVLIEGPARLDLQPPEGDQDPRTFSDKILDTQGMIVDSLKELREGPPAQLQNQDPITTAMAIIGAFQSVMAPYQEMLLNRGDGKPNFGELVKIFQQGVELGKISNPPGEDPMSSVLAATLPGLMKAINAGEQSAPQPLDVLTNPPAPAETSGPPAPQRPPWDVLLSPYLPMLWKWARAGANPSLRAAFVVDEIPPEAADLLLEEVERGPAFVREFLLLHPEAKLYEKWLTNFWRGVADQFDWDPGTHPFHGEQVEAELGTLPQDPGPPAGVEVAVAPIEDS